MRVTQRMMTNNAIQYMDENLKRLYDLQEKVASGKEFLRPSDNPSGMASALSLRSTLTTTQSYLDTTISTDSWMSAADFSLNQMIDIATDALNLTRSGLSDTMGAQQRDAMATEIDSILQQAVSLGNTNHAGNYIFGGFQTKSPPFELQKSDPSGPYDSVGWSGDDGVITRLISPGVTINQNINGMDNFMNLYNALIDARDALRTNDSAQIQAALSPLENALQVVNDAMTTNGARQRQTRIVQESLERAQLEIKSLLSAKEDVNMTEAISNLTHQQTVYQTVLEVGQRAISAVSLFDLLG